MKILRISRFLIGSIVIFIFGVTIGATLFGTRREKCLTDYPLLVTAKTDKISQTVQNEVSSQFSFMYNKTHLWSIRLADENYYRIANHLPCRTVEYLGGPIPDKMSSCEKSTRDEFSVEATIHAQKWIYQHQNPMDCTNKRFALIHSYAMSGFGSTVHQIVWAFGTALSQGRIAIYQTPGNWVRKYCY